MGGSQRLHAVVKAQLKGLRVKLKRHAARIMALDRVTAEIASRSTDAGGGGRDSPVLTAKQRARQSARERAVARSASAQLTTSYRQLSVRSSAHVLLLQCT